jgi:hypothetical protein
VITENDLLILFRRNATVIHPYGHEAEAVFEVQCICLCHICKIGISNCNCMMLNTGEKWIIVNHEASVITELR